MGCPILFSLWLYVLVILFVGSIFRPVRLGDWPTVFIPLRGRGRIYGLLPHVLALKALLYLPVVSIGALILVFGCLYFVFVLLLLLLLLLVLL